MQDLCDLKVHINGQHTFFLNQRVISTFSGRLKKIIKQEQRNAQIRGSGIEIIEFPGGPDGFELVSRFCYNKGRIKITPSNISVLHCSAIFLEMTEKITSCNLLQQTETFLDGLFYWTLSDILTSLKSCESFFTSADSSGLLNKLISSLSIKITANSDLVLAPSSPSSSSSPDTSGLRSSLSTKTPDTIKSSFNKPWWFDDLTILSPKIIEKIIQTMGAYETGNNNNNLILTRFILHYLKTVVQVPGVNGSRFIYGNLADKAVNGVVLIGGKTAFSCRGLLWVLRVVSGLGLSKDCRVRLERLIGGMLDQATLDDLLVSGADGGAYDVNLVLRLVKVFVNEEDQEISLYKMKRVGRLLDKYMGEISPDQSLKVSKFLGVAESLPDSARDCFDGVYRALDIYLESHPTLTSEERTRLCRCLNYEKLTLEACKDLAKNTRIPPRIAMQALIAQQSKIKSKENRNPDDETGEEASTGGDQTRSSELLEKEELRMNLQKMQWRVVELEQVCKEMKGQMSKMEKNKAMSSLPAHGRAMHKLC